VIKRLHGLFVLADYFTLFSSVGVRELLVLYFKFDFILDFPFCCSKIIGFRCCFQYCYGFVVVELNFRPGLLQFHNFTLLLDFLSGSCWHQRSNLVRIFAELLQTSDQGVFFCWCPLDLMLAVRESGLLALSVPVKFRFVDFALLFKFFQGSVFSFSFFQVPFLYSLINHDHPFRSLPLFLLRVTIIPLNPPNLEHTCSLLLLVVSLRVTSHRSTNNLLLLQLVKSLQLRDLGSIQGIHRPG